ncbi:ABC transporter permease [Paludibaculum fermentans]|uniref:ABC transporter permease n=1 Tax=Paludibaculum fermentans TaxID=1473598 RepID=UPI003EBDD6CE
MTRQKLRLRDETRDADLFVWLDTLLRDLRHAARSLRRRPAFVATALASLALGIGANSAIFSVVDAALLRPLPIPDSGRLVMVKEFKGSESSGGNPQRLRDWATQVDAFLAAAAFYGESVIWRSNGGPVRLQMVRTFGDIFPVLAVAPALGRAFTAAETRGLGAPVVLLSDAAWRRHFSADPRMMQRSIVLSGTAFTIIGVMPPSLQYPEEADVWSPGPADVQNASRQAGFLDTIGRLKPGVSLQLAQTTVETVAARLRQQYPATDRALHARVVPLQEEVAGEARTPLLVLLGAAGCVLLLTCVNLTSLLLARAGERAREASIRAALGAGRGGLVRLFLLESGLLALAGAGLSLLAALFGIDLLKSLLPQDLPRLGSASLDVRVLVFTALLALSCALFFGLAPAWRASRINFAAGLKEGGSGATAVRRDSWFRGLLVVVQVALSVVLVVGAALLAITFQKLRQTPLGFRPQQVLVVMVEQPWNTAKPELDRFQSALLERFRAIPGVRTAGFADRLPLEGGSQTGPVQIQGRTLPPALESAAAGRRAYGGDYFQAMNIPLLQGSWPVRKDQVLINRTFAERYLAGTNPVGQHVTFDRKNPKWLEVTGVVGDTRKSVEKSADAEVYADMSTVYWPMARYALRAQGDPTALTRAVREGIQAVDPTFIPSAIRTMDEGIDRSVSSQKTRASLIGGFALAALLLACVGIYGLLAGDVTQRRQEIGLRIALGARPADIFSLTMWRGLRLAVLGLTLGLGAAYALSSALGSLLYGVQPGNPLVYAAGCAVALSAASLACLLPARRAVRTDPISSLRHE